MGSAQIIRSFSRRIKSHKMDWTTEKGSAFSSSSLSVTSDWFEEARKSLTSRKPKNLVQQTRLDQFSFY